MCRLRETSMQLITAIKSGNPQEVAKVIQQVQAQAQVQAGATGGRVLPTTGVAVAATRNIRTAEGESITQRIVATQPQHVPQPQPPRETPPISTIQPPPQVQRVIENVQRLRQVSEQLINAVRSGSWRPTSYDYAHCCCFTTTAGSKHN